MNRTIFIIGGSHSGKSAQARNLAAQYPQHPLIWIDPAPPDQFPVDDGSEEGVGGVVESAEPSPPGLAEMAGLLEKESSRPSFLVWDSITHCVRQAWEKGAGDVLQRIEEALSLARKRRGVVIFIADEMGGGIVPAEERERGFRDLLGAVNQKAAAGCDEVVHMVAGIPRTIKSLPGEGSGGEEDAGVLAEFTPEKKQGLYDAIYQRRDMRHFLPKPVPSAVLWRLLDAAHHAGSVGFMQPWNFLVIKDRQIRQAVAKNFQAANEQGAGRFAGERRELYGSLKLEGILEAPLNLCVTCDSSRGGPHVLGRDTIPETDLYSTCCAVLNLWLAARAEGLGVGWVSILSVESLKETLGIPAHVQPVAYLCIGYPRGFYPAPMLEEAGWAQRLPLRDLVFQDQWSRAPDSSPDGD